MALTSINLAGIVSYTYRDVALVSSPCIPMTPTVLRYPLYMKVTSRV